MIRQEIPHFGLRPQAVRRHCVMVSLRHRVLAIEAIPAVAREEIPHFVRNDMLWQPPPQSGTRLPHFVRNDNSFLSLRGPVLSWSEAISNMVRLLPGIKKKAACGWAALRFSFNQVVLFHLFLGHPNHTRVLDNKDHNKDDNDKREAED